MIWRCCNGAYDRVMEHGEGGYRFTSGISAYSGGVIAEPGLVLDHVTFRRRLGWRKGFEAVAEHLAMNERPPAALCAVELRCPRPHPFDGFGSFNAEYRAVLDSWGVLLGDQNPVARTNVAPTIDTGTGTELNAFSFTVPRAGDRAPGSGRGDAVRPSFVIAGAGDLSDQADLRPEAIVGGQTPWAVSGPDRAAAVLDEMESRLATLDLSWAETDSVVAYSVEHIGAVLDSTVLPRLGTAGRNGVHWFNARPPVEGLLFEIDTRGGVVERRL